MDLVISESARGHTSLDVVIADQTRVDLVARATIVPQHATLGVVRPNELHYNGRPRGDTFIPIAIETYDALLSQTNDFLREHFPSMADHPLVLASSSLGFGDKLRSHLSVRKLERFMRIRLVLRRSHLCYLHSPLSGRTKSGV